MSEPVKWRRDTGWWDDLEVPKSGGKKFDWAAFRETAPREMEHDYLLYTDGSGCTKGWGGYASLIHEIDLDSETGFRGVARSWPLIAGTYGSTVQRCEFNAMIDGVHSIISKKCADIVDEAKYDDEMRYTLGSEGVMSQLRGPDRLTIMWFTDRANLASSFLFNEDGSPHNARDKERDLWMRWSWMSRHVCITPIAIPRNSIDEQAVCDAWAGAARAAMRDQQVGITKHSQQFIDKDKWEKNLSQKAQF